MKKEHKIIIICSALILVLIIIGIYGELNSEGKAIYLGKRCLTNSDCIYTNNCFNGQCMCRTQLQTCGTKVCGSVINECSQTFSCGTCALGSKCYLSKCCVPKTKTVACLTNTPTPIKCGSVSDGCGGTITCGLCALGQTCYNKNCCTPKTCAQLGKNCGSVSNGCGGTLNCGSCTSDQTCTNSVCVSLYYDEEGRLTDYARSLAPPMLELNLNELPKLYPEEYGNNYFEPGTYTIQLGDGFGKGNFLIKFVEFIPSEEPGDGKNKILFEVFKKERDGNYYHFPTDQSESYISNYGIKDLVGISFESFTDQINLNENILTYHSDCTIFYDYCYDSNSYFYALSHQQCDWRCAFDANIGEIKIQNGVFSAIFPAIFPEEYVSFSSELLEQCYQNNLDFLKYNPQKTRIGVKVMLAESPSGITGFDEYVSTKQTEVWLNDQLNILKTINNENVNKRCPNFLALSHELTHILTKELLGNNYGLGEGIAEYVSFQNDYEPKYICRDNNWGSIITNEEILYVDLSTSPMESVFNQAYYYATGFCFWQDFVKEYSYPNFVKLMQKLYTKSRGIDDYYAFDVMEEVIGQPLSAELLNRYSLTRESTKVELCKNCEIFN